MVPPLRLVVPDPVLPDSAVGHLNNALQLIRGFLDYGEMLIGANEPSVAVAIAGLAALQARIEAARELLELPPGSL